MSTRSTRDRRASLAVCSLAILSFAAGSAHAAEAADAKDNPDIPEVEAVIVTAPKGAASEAAPVKGSLTATEPQAVITRQFIEESAPRVGDFTTTAILAPSMGGVPNANGPGATDGAKITMRGFADGEFNITYDGIAWGDTNGPSHHANSFFPSSVIGGVVIDRGPGKADEMGQANFGGSLNLFSLPFEDHMGVRQTATAGSFQTYQGVTTLASGPMASLHGLNAVANFMEYKTAGYLTNSDSQGQNQFIKFAVPLTDKITLTALFTKNNDSYYQGDASASATVAQIEAFGIRYALGNDPTLQTYYKYNYTKKQTDFEYIKLAGDLGAGFSFDNTLYSYWYSNKTLSALNNGADSTLGATALAAANKVILTPAATYPNGGSGYSSALKVNGLPGYLKRNEYRVWGDHFKLFRDTEIGRFTVGGLWELARTQRSRFDIDLLTKQPDYREKAATFAPTTGCGTLTARSAPGQTWDGACIEPLNVAYSEYSGWTQYQAFGEFEWRATDKLTITPGVKYVSFKNEFLPGTTAVAVSGSIQPLFAAFTHTKTLPYLTANYRYRSNWSFYGQFAQGFLVPNISAYYVNQPASQPVVPQTSTNYQLGTVFNAGHLVIDADVYYIDFQHKIQTVTVAGETQANNSGGAIYKGLELQGTYLLSNNVSLFANYSKNDTKAVDDPINPGGNGHPIAKAPFYTYAFGVRGVKHGLLSGDDSLISTLNFKAVGPQYIIAASGASGPTGLIKTFGEADFSTTYKFGNFSLQAQVLNLADRHDLTSFKGKALIAGTTSPALTSAQGGAGNTPVFQSGRSFQVTLKAAF